jgi:hypothetical protein
VASRTPGVGRADGLVRDARADALGGEHSGTSTNSGLSNGRRS